MTYGPALPSTGKPKSDEYLYGPHAVVASSGTSSDVGTKERPKASSDAPASQVDAAVATVPEHSKPPSETAAPPPVEARQDFAGNYQGTDWVTIDLPGVSGDEQVDERARVSLLALPTKGRYSFTVLDTNSGSELCVVEGSLVGKDLVLDEGQSCFEGILGVPMDASLYEGEASLVGETLTVTLGVELTLARADGDLTGELSYRFEGKLAPVVDDGK